MVGAIAGAAIGYGISSAVEQEANQEAQRRVERRQSNRQRDYDDDVYQNDRDYDSGYGGSREFDSEVVEGTPVAKRCISISPST